MRIQEQNYSPYRVSMQEKNYITLAEINKYKISEYSQNENHEIKLKKPLYREQKRIVIPSQQMKGE